MDNLDLIEGIVMLLLTLLGVGTGYRLHRPSEPAQGPVSASAAEEARAPLEEMRTAIEGLSARTASLERQTQRVSTDVSQIASAMITLVTHLDDEIPAKASDTVIGKVSSLRSHEVTSLHTRAL